MRISVQPSRSPRRGVAIAEMAFFSVMFFTMLFGLLEYCRLLYMFHVANNAARDAARYASCHTNGGTMNYDFSGTSVSEPVTITDQMISDIATYGSYTSGGRTFTFGSGMCGMQNAISGYAVLAYADDTPAVNWTNTPFGKPVTVRISGTYNAISPLMLFMQPSFTFTVRGMVCSEAN